MSDIGTIAQKVGSLLKVRGETIAVAESSSGGLISAALLAVPGASAYFKGGSTVYTGGAKRILMELSADVMEANRPATQAHALDLARAAKARLDADWGMGCTVGDVDGDGDVDLAESWEHGDRPLVVRYDLDKDADGTIDETTVYDWDCP